MRKGIVRWPFLAVGVVSMLFAGIIYAWSILKAPLGDAFGWTASQLAMNFTLTMCFFCIGGVVSGVLTKRTSPKVTVLCAAALSWAGFALTSRLSGQVIMLYITYGVMCGLGIGMAYNAVIASTNAWFPDKKGVCSGALMMGFGASTLVLGNVAGTMIETPAIGWRGTYLILGILIGVVLLVTARVVRLPSPEEAGALPKPKQKKARKSEDSFETRDYTTPEMIQRPSFWRFFLFTIAMAAVGNTVISFAKDLALSVGASAALATTLVGVLSVCNGLGRILCGAIFDALDRRKTMLLSNVLTILAPTVTLGAIGMGSVPPCVAGLCLTGISYGCAPTISSAFVATFYGTKHFAMNFSIANTMLIPASFTATLASALAASTGGYMASVLMLIAFAVVGFVLNLSIKQP